MSTYKGIKGFSIKYLSADPPAVNEGQMWYNSTDQKLKIFGLLPGGTAWATGDTLAAIVDTARGAGTVTSALIFGGNNPTDTPTVGSTNASQSYNGTAWSIEPTMPYYTAGHFTNNDTNGLSSSFVAGGYISANYGQNNSASWNGTTWSSEATFPNAVRYGFSGGTGENIIASGGLTASPLTGFPGASSTYNGTAWSSAPALNTNRSNGCSGGSFPSSIAFAGCAPPYCTGSNVTETWNGTSWSPAAAYPASTSLNATSFAGGGMPTGIFIDESVRNDWNGTAWASGTAAPISITGSAGFGTSSNATFAGGVLTGTPGSINTTQSWITASPSIAALDVTTS